MPRIFNPQRLMLSLAAAVVMMAASSTAWADPITITVGNPNNQGTDNVLFNNATLVHSGLLVQGDFNGAGAGFIVDFTSAATATSAAGGGQAVLVGGAGNTLFERHRSTRKRRHVPETDSEHRRHQRLGEYVGSVHC